MKLCVVDASVAAKWLLPIAQEGLIEQANRLLASHVSRDLQLVAPDLILCELGNVLWKSIGRARIKAQDSERALQRFMDLEIQIFPAADLIISAIEIANAYDRTFYDSLYVALAVTAKTELLTADERLVNAVGSRLPVRWLGTY